ncbi:MAG: YbhB/YbcL family Raf kinase inhibitor-like protein [Syntrophales bacterium LBB04]|nr:YbhB/YbcL family Raf kinase inhibitor-like protein [Syntrophales bacterium LBB04]
MDVLKAIRNNNICIGIFAAAIFSFGTCRDAISAPKGVEKMQITSTAFTEGNIIPAKYTCDGRDISPPLEWKDVPANTKSFALISDDPDAPGGMWVHWVIYNIPSHVTKFDENVTHEKEFKNGMRQGNNDWPKLGYGGPCPPSGVHRYYFKIYALDGILDLKPGATKAQLLQAMKGYILAEAQLMGKYSRQK